MKAVFIEQFGGPEVLKYGDLPDPVAEPGEVIVDVVAASVNAADWKFRAGEYTRHALSKFPLIPGPSRHSFASLQRMRLQQDTASHRRTSDRFRNHRPRGLRPEMEAELRANCRARPVPKAMGVTVPRIAS